MNPSLSRIAKKKISLNNKELQFLIWIGILTYWPFLSFCLPFVQTLAPDYMSPKWGLDLLSSGPSRTKKIHKNSKLYSYSLQKWIGLKPHTHTHVFNHASRQHDTSGPRSQHCLMLNILNIWDCLLTSMDKWDLTHDGTEWK